MARLLCFVLALSLASHAAAEEAVPVHVKVTGYVRGSCRVQAVRPDEGRLPGCNVPWKQSRDSEGSEDSQGRGKPASRITLTPVA